ncbi:hypothetical protein D9619_009716 [Psilocybe cf. subviscida]|uniref:Origin recognition complex subunit 3 winged helix C-terminal domain-containing protein n=1 Tax=Psilocybe cf. subviscida TaxID=2480587 RepID=A0A8H5F6P2_9AGAR|nr:hypothetical protein D9619_009716 [Psilocybe cf. subviscida]
MRGTGANDLDDFSKTAVYIPFNPSGTKGDDSEDGSDWDLRVVAYKDAWKKCLSRMQWIVLQLQHTSAKEIVVEVRTSYRDTLPGLPHPEIPVVSVINPAMGSSFSKNITDQLDGHHGCSLIQLYPGDFPNLVTGMRSIISGFVQKTEVPQQVKHKGGTALASYDIKLLAAWYEAWARSINFRPNLVIVLHDFEQLDPLIMQDVFDICSQVPQLPIVFLLSMTHPLSNYLNITYPRSTLSLLRVRTFTTLTGQHILNEVLLKTFFDLDFRPAVMIGPSTIQYLQEYFSRYHSSVDTIFTIIQLAYMKHFATEPLAIIANSTPSADLLEQHGLVESLQASLSRQKDGDVNMDSSSSLDALLAAIDDARARFQMSMHKKRIALRIILLARALLQHQGHSGVSLSTRESKKTAVDVMTDVLQGREEQDFVEKILNVVCDLNADDLEELLEGVYQYLTEADYPSRYIKLRTDLVTMRGSLKDMEGDALSDIAADVADWIEAIFQEGLMKLEDNALWEAWYTGLSPFPRELLNPSIRASLMAGLLRPFEFQDDFAEQVTNENGAKSIAELPDTSILFKRYLDSGKMINVYDWFESFKSVLDTQDELIRTRAVGSASPKKGKGKAKGAAAEAERDDDKWNVEVQARFIRALHELDYLGFIKHTGRKADHVQRTVFDIDDPE